MLAYVARLPGLRAVGERCGRQLGTRAISSIAEALARRSSLRFVRSLVARLETAHQPGDEELVVLDGMAVTLPRTQRHGCAKFNNKTVGGGVVWAYLVGAAREVCPVKVLKIVEGAWSDARVMRDVALHARGPVYVMDRGFAACALFEQWLAQEVRFIARLRVNMLREDDMQRVLSPPRRIGALALELDALVRLGGARVRAHPTVRVIVARLRSGERLILATERMEWSAERVLEAYRKRWHIERFHRLLKDTLGLSHLYSFQSTGIAFLICTALLTVLLLYFAQRDPHGATIELLRRMLMTVRAALGLGTPWKRNSCIRPRNKKRPTNKLKTTGR